MNTDKEWLAGYFNMYRQSISNSSVYDDLLRIREIWLDASNQNKKIIFTGNGGSAAIASHCAVDLTKNGGVRAVNFNEADLITCFANDYGYENWVSRAIEFYGDNGDVAILISSGGSSANMVNAANTANKFGMQVITFTGFNEDNPLKQSGDLNFWVDSRAYNVVENTHQIWLLLVCDLIIGKAEYSV